MAGAPDVTLNYGLRYDYYVPLREADNRIVKFNIDNGQLDPNTTALQVEEEQFPTPCQRNLFSDRSAWDLRKPSSFPFPAGRQR